jgi:hypothetical protein
MVGINRFACITVAVKDQGEALQMVHPRSSGFQNRLDRPDSGMRVLMVSPAKQPGLQVIPASWFPEHVGKNPTTVPYSTYDELRGRGVVFTKASEGRPFGLEAAFKDWYANSYALLEPGASHGRD